MWKYLSYFPQVLVTFISAKTKSRHHFKYTDSHTLKQSDESSQENGLAFGKLTAAAVVVGNSYKTIPGGRRARRRISLV